MFNSTIYINLKRIIYKCRRSINIHMEKIRLQSPDNPLCPCSSLDGFGFDPSPHLNTLSTIFSCATDRQTDSKIDRQKDRQIGRQTDRQIVRQTDRQTVRPYFSHAPVGFSVHAAETRPLCNINKIIYRQTGTYSGFNLVRVNRFFAPFLCVADSQGAALPRKALGGGAKDLWPLYTQYTPLLTDSYLNLANRPNSLCFHAQDAKLKLK